MARSEKRLWQEAALRLWVANGHRGIVAVVTGGGKTVFALQCIDAVRPETTLVLVPTLALIDQWWEEVASFFDLRLDDVNVVPSSGRLRTGTVNLAVLNSAAKFAERVKSPVMLIVDECHRAAAATLRAALHVPTVATLGLSATPERPYDEGLGEVLVPAIGPVIYSYDYRDALRDGVIVPFILHHVVFELEADTQREYDKLTRSIGRVVSQEGVDSEKAIALFLKRSRTLNMSPNRMRLAVRLVAQNPGRRILIFHEDISSCELIAASLVENGVRAGVYHSRLPGRARADALAAYRAGRIDVLVTCRALDEGFNVPETEIGILAAGTATERQRVQRLGRVLRPATGKSRATVFTLVATGPEIQRLKEEERELEGVAETVWSSA